jgi:hypothetical protein
VHLAQELARNVDGSGMSTDWAQATPAGWYPDPHQPGQVRYWDGASWTGHTHTSGPVAFPTASVPATVPFGIGKALRVMLTVQTVAFGVLTLVALNYYAKGNDFLDNPTFSNGDAATSAENAYLGLWSILAVSGIACGVLLIIWSFQTSKWAQTQGAAMRHTPGWAIGGWFIPCANLFIPFRVLNDLYRYAEPGLPRPIYDRYQGRPGCNVLWGWILSLVVAQSLYGSANSLFTDDATASDVRTALTLRVIAPMVAAFSVLMMLLYLRATSARLETTVATTYAGAGAVPFG